MSIEMRVLCWVNCSDSRNHGGADKLQSDVTEAPQVDERAAVELPLMTCLRKNQAITPPVSACAATSD